MQHSKLLTHDHSVSAGHKTALSVLHSREQQQLKIVAANQMQQQQEETCRVWRTVYYVAQSDRPYTDHADLIELQELNDISLGPVLHSNTVCSS